jgi:hypothetical protein
MRNITVDSIKSLLIIGLVFLINGVTLLIIGYLTNLTAFWALGPPLIALGVSFLAIAKSRKNALGSPSSSSSSDA